MNNSNIPFRFYDHIGVIFPGTILLGVILFVYPELTVELKKVNSISTVILIFIIFVSTYICGHASYIISKKITDLFGIQQDKFKEYKVEIQNEIINKIENYYKTDFNLRVDIIKYREGSIKGKDLQIKNLCLPYVDINKIIDYEKFVSLADFCRSTALNLLITLLIYLIYYCSNQIVGFGPLRSTLLILGIGGSSYLLFMRSISFRKSADSIIYSSFLASEETTKKK